MLKRILFAVMVISILRIIPSVHAQVEFYKTSAQMSAQFGVKVLADSLFLGASFVYEDSTKPIIVSLYGGWAAWTGALYFMVPDTNKEHFLFNNMNNGQNPTNINLSQLFTIPVGTELVFCYKVLSGNGDPRPKYTGQNRPGVDTYVSQAINSPFGRRWCVAGKIMDSSGIPTDSVELGYEDGGGEDFLDVVFHIKGLGLITTTMVTIMAEQLFTVSEDAPAGTLVGNIKLSTSDLSKVTMKVINNIPEFEVSSSAPFSITVANGANLDYDTKNSYSLTVVATAGSGSSTISDTSIIVVLILDATMVINNGIVKNNVTCPVVASDNLIIKGLTDGVYNLSITNLKGQEMLKIENGSKTMIDISTFPFGVYFVALTSKNRKVFNKIYINQ